MRGLAFPPTGSSTPDIPEPILSPATTTDDIPIDPALATDEPLDPVLFPDPTPPVSRVFGNASIASNCPRLFHRSQSPHLHPYRRRPTTNGPTSDSPRAIHSRRRSQSHSCLSFRTSSPIRRHPHIRSSLSRSAGDFIARNSAVSAAETTRRTNATSQSPWSLAQSADGAVCLLLYVDASFHHIYYRPPELYGAL